MEGKFEYKKFKKNDTFGNIFDQVNFYEVNI